MESSASCDGTSELSSGRSNATDLSGTSDNLFMLFVRLVIDPVSSSLDSSESYSVSPFVESSSVVKSGVVSGSRSFSNHFMQRRVGCSPPHSLHCSGGPMSFLIRSAYVRVDCSVLRSTFVSGALTSIFIDMLGCGAFTVRFRVLASTFREWSRGEAMVPLFSLVLDAFL